MNINASKLWPDIRDIQMAPLPPAQSVSLVLHTTTDDYPIPKLLSIDIDRDYRSSYTDKINVKCVIPLGELVHILYPQDRDNEETDIYDVFIEASVTTKTGNRVRVARYRAWIPTELYRDIKPETYLLHHSEQLNQASHEIDIQLTSLGTEPLKLLKTQGSFTEPNRSNWLNNTLGYAVQKVTVNGLPPIDKIDVHPTDNDLPLQDMIVPTGTPTVQLPYFLQSKEGGLYKAGIGSYAQYYQGQMIWFVYPLYNPLVYKDRREKAVLYLTDNRFLVTEMEVTYRQQGAILSIVGAMSPGDAESTTRRMANQPLSAEITNANSVTIETVTAKGGKLTGAGDLTHHTVSVADRPDGLNITTPTNHTTTNYYGVVSELYKNNGYVISAMWGNSRADLLRPGMGFTVYTETKYGIRQRYATLLHTHTVKRVLGVGATAKMVQSTTHLTLFIER